MKVYLDYSATTPLAPEVKQALHTFLEETFGNPSSPHRFGQRAKIVLEETRDRLAARLQCLPREIIFTSGGTESNNLALIGAANANRNKGNHLIIPALEHASVLAGARHLEKNGFDITWLESDSGGVITAAAVEAQLRPSTILVSIMYVNNETGVINPVKDIAELCRDRGILYHIDAVQAFGKIPLSLAEISAALVSVSAHKIYAPKGVGALFIRQGVALDALMYGGAQEANRRPGTENMPGIAGFGAALYLPDNSITEAELISGLQKDFEHRLTELIPVCQVIGRSSPRSPYISNISFPGLSNESLLLNLDLAGIAASAGSACSSGSLRQSHVLKAMRLPDHVINGAVRFSFGRFTTMAEIDYTLSALKEIWQRLAGKRP